MGALKLHDPLLIALPIAIFVDLLHYRSVTRAVRSGGAWWLAALVTTGIAFGLQFVFYTGKDNAGGFLPYLYASIVPLGLAIMALLSHAAAGEKLRDWAQELADMRQALIAAQEEAQGATAAAQAAEALKQEALAMQREAEALKREATEEQQRATAAQQKATEEQQRATAAQREAEALKQEALAMQREAKATEEEAAAGRLALGYWPHLNDQTAAGLRYLAGAFVNMETAAQAAGLP
jgi:flagellar biosynthesis GTPase FlhF